MITNSWPLPVESCLKTCRDLAIPVDVIHHDANGASTQGAAAALQEPADRVLKTLILKTDKGFCVAIIRGDQRLDFGALKRLMAAKSVQMAQPAEIVEFSGFEKGGVPPVVFVGRCPVFVDPGVLAQAYVIGSAGTPHHGLRISPQETFRTLAARIEQIAALPSCNGRTP